jgi:hypothetical protein
MMNVLSTMETASSSAIISFPAINVTVKMAMHYVKMDKPAMVSSGLHAPSNHNVKFVSRY